MAPPPSKKAKKSTSLPTAAPTASMTTAATATPNATAATQQRNNNQQQQQQQQQRNDNRSRDKAKGTKKNRKEKEEEETLHLPPLMDVLRAAYEKKHPTNHNDDEEDDDLQCWHTKADLLQQIPKTHWPLNVTNFARPLPVVALEFVDNSARHEGLVLEYYGFSVELNCWIKVDVLGVKNEEDGDEQMEEARENDDEEGEEIDEVEEEVEEEEGDEEVMDDESWINDDDQEFSELIIAVPLITNGAIGELENQTELMDEEELSKAFQFVKSHLQTVDNKCKLKSATISKSEAAKNAQLLPDVLESISNTEITVILSSGKDEYFDPLTVWEILSGTGLKYSSSYEWFEYVDDSISRQCLFLVTTNTPPGKLSAERICSGEWKLKDLRFSLLPFLTTAAEEALELMAKTIKYCQKKLGGEIQELDGSLFSIEMSQNSIKECNRLLTLLQLEPGDDIVFNLL